MSDDERLKKLAAKRWEPKSEAELASWEETRAHSKQNELEDIDRQAEDVTNQVAYYRSTMHGFMDMLEHAENHHARQLNEACYEITVLRAQATAANELLRETQAELDAVKAQHLVRNDQVTALVQQLLRMLGDKR